MSKTKTVFGIVLVAFLAGGCACFMGGKKGPTCIVLPARHTMVEFCFELTKLRQKVYLISYDKVPSDGSAFLHIWDEKNRTWTKMGIEQYTSASIFTEQPKTVILLGSDAELPQEMTGATQWCSDVSQIRNLDIVSLMNGFHKVFSFSSREWNHFSKLYNVKYEDLNAELRAYGKYGRPGSETTLPTPVEQPANNLTPIAPEKEIEPAAIIEEPVGDLPKPAPAPKIEIKTSTPIPAEDK